MKTYHVIFRSTGYGTKLDTVTRARNSKAAVARGAKSLRLRAKLLSERWTFKDLAYLSSSTWYLESAYPLVP